jgi:hypothetical protein
MNGHSVLRIPAILMSAGVLFAGTILFLFYAISNPSSRSNTFTFTAWFSAAQVVFLLSALLYAAIKDGRPDSVVPVNSAIVEVVFFYNVVALSTILLFTRYLLPLHHSEPRNYYTICATEALIAAVIVILLQLVVAAHQMGHAESVQRRVQLNELLQKCEAISSNAVNAGWTLDVKRCSDRIRFSEAIRTDPALSLNVLRLLSELEVLTSSAPQEPTLGEARKIVTEIESTALRNR